MSYDELKTAILSMPPEEREQYRVEMNVDEYERLVKHYGDVLSTSHPTTFCGIPLRAVAGNTQLVKQQ